LAFHSSSCSGYSIAENLFDPILEILCDNPLQDTYNAIDTSDSHTNAICFAENCPQYLPTGGHDNGGAYQFDGVQSILSVPNHQYDILESFSWSIWIKHNIQSLNGNGWRCIMGMDERSEGINNGSLYGLWFNPSADLTIFSHVCCPSILFTVEFTPLVFNHLVLTVNTSGNATVYLNGTLLSAQPLSDPQCLPAADMRFGNNGNDFDEPWLGMLDDIRIYNRTLKFNEIEVLASNESIHLNATGDTASVIESSNPSTRVTLIISLTVILGSLFLISIGVIVYLVVRSKTYNEGTGGYSFRRTWAFNSRSNFVSSFYETVVRRTPASEESPHAVPPTTPTEIDGIPSPELIQSEE